MRRMDLFLFLLTIFEIVRELFFLIKRLFVEFVCLNHKKLHVFFFITNLISNFGNKFAFKLFYSLSRFLGLFLVFKQTKDGGKLELDSLFFFGNGALIRRLLLLFNTKIFDKRLSQFFDLLSGLC